MHRYRFLVAVALALIAGVSLPGAAPARHTAAGDIPGQLSDKEFWRLSTSLSERPGSFLSENLVSNETMFQWVIPDLMKTVPTGGVYLGVAPDQNFTYIVALRPRIAFIVDIRRGNVIEHLLYKALIEMSADRADFVSRLFSRKRPAGLGPESTPADLMDAYGRVVPDADSFAANQDAVLALLEKKHGFALSAGDEADLRWIYGAFFSFGPDLTYMSSMGSGGLSIVKRGGGVVALPDRGLGGFVFNAPPSGALVFRSVGGAYATYGELQTQTDADGLNHTYLATEINYKWLKAFEAKNLIVPLTGDFAGPSALRAVGQYVRDHGSTIGAFYVSNVEQYLFQQGNDASRFYQNVATLPLDASSTFIRSVPGTMIRPAQAGARAASMLCSMSALVNAFAAGKINSYFDVMEMSRQVGGVGGTRDSRHWHWSRGLAPLRFDETAFRR